MTATGQARLGRSSVTVGRTGLGTGPLGGLFAKVSDEQAHAALAAAWDSGIRYFDTAPHYGAGLAEERLGAFLTDRPRAEFTVSTKVGRLLQPGAPEPDAGFHGGRDRVRVLDYSADGVRRSLSESLERSGLDAFDLVLIHDPDDHWEPAVREAYPALERLRAEGVVKAVGVGMNQAAMLGRFVTETDIDCVMLSGRYTLLDRTAAEALLPRCQERGVSVLACGVFNSGVLADPRPGAHFDYAPASEDVLRRARRLADRCAAHGVALPAAAIAFPLRHPAVTGVVLGARSADEVLRNVEHTATRIPDELWAELDATETDA
ncbi:aldo/keto reductase [Streptomyces sp. B6B3]|uniref:aldo/keto reductase n=1 Tax=Streptomyces sp. B6B3 TaxID=3153570 RepID=UPI00325F265A